MSNKSPDLLKEFGLYAQSNRLSHSSLKFPENKLCIGTGNVPHAMLPRYLEVLCF